MNPDAKEYAGIEAKRLLDELTPYFDELEHRAIEELVRASPLADRKRRCLADRIRVIRELKGQLQSLIVLGKTPPHISRIA